MCAPANSSAEAELCDTLRLLHRQTQDGATSVVTNEVSGKECSLATLRRPHTGEATPTSRFLFFTLWKCCSKCWVLNCQNWNHMIIWGGRRLSKEALVVIVLQHQYNLTQCIIIVVGTLRIVPLLSCFNVFNSLQCLQNVIVSGSSADFLMQQTVGCHPEEVSSVAIICGNFFFFFWRNNCCTHWRSSRAQTVLHPRQMAQELINSWRAAKTATKCTCAHSETKHYTPRPNISEGSRPCSALQLTEFIWMV